MKKILLIAVIFVSGACNNKNDILSKVKQNELKTYFTEVIKGHDSSYKLDSFRVIKLDTITKKKIFKLLLSDAFNLHNINLRNDTLLVVDSDSLLKKLYNADSISVILYQAVCIYQYRIKDTSVSKDTTDIFLNTDMNIMAATDLKKIILNLYK